MNVHIFVTHSTGIIFPFTLKIKKMSFIFKIFSSLFLSNNQQKFLFKVSTLFETSNFDDTEKDIMVTNFITIVFIQKIKFFLIGVAFTCAGIEGMRTSTFTALYYAFGVLLAVYILSFLKDLIIGYKK